MLNPLSQSSVSAQAASSLSADLSSSLLRQGDAVWGGGEKGRIDSFIDRGGELNKMRTGVSSCVWGGETEAKKRTEERRCGR